MLNSSCLNTNKRGQCQVYLGDEDDEDEEEDEEVDANSEGDNDEDNSLHCCSCLNHQIAVDSNEIGEGKEEGKDCELRIKLSGRIQNYSLI